MKALITGGSGFIGKALARELEATGTNVLTFDTSYDFEAIHHRRGSILDIEDVEHSLEGVDIVFHLAGVIGTTELLKKSIEATDVNIKGTLNVFEASLRRNVRTVFFPTMPAIWLNAYSISKRAGEDFARMYARWRGLDVRILRWLNVYGPGQKAYPVRKAVPMMILQALFEKEIEIWGSGNQPVFLVYVDDLAKTTAHYCLAERGDSVPRDAGNAIQLTVNELAETIRRLTNSRSEIRHLSMRPGEDPNISVKLLSGATAADMLGFESATTPLEKGLQKTIQYFASLPKRDLQTALDFYYPK